MELTRVFDFIFQKTNMPNNPIYILDIESSCDDTGASVLVNDKILSNVVSKQEIHEEYGGVIPELASRVHQVNIVPTVDIALKKAGINKSQLSAIAFTQGPGLMGSLLVGSSFAKSMAYCCEERIRYTHRNILDKSTIHLPFEHHLIVQ